MGWIVTLLVGGLIGWVASRVMNTDAQQGIILNIVVGIVGAMIAARWSTMTSVASFTVDHSRSYVACVPSTSPPAVATGDRHSPRHCGCRPMRSGLSRCVFRVGPSCTTLPTREACCVRRQRAGLFGTQSARATHLSWKAPARPQTQ